MELSVVIIVKNGESIIRDCINSAKLISNDIIVADSGSADKTIEIAREAGARVLELEWKGYGATRNIAVEASQNEWVFALDSDERITKELAEQIKMLPNTPTNKVYGFKRVSYVEKKKIRFGDWGSDKVYRLYCHKYTEWDNALVHENLKLQGAEKKIIGGKLLHFTMPNKLDFDRKTNLYARLSAEKYFLQQKKASFLKIYLSPCFDFIKTYFIKFGFLDGSEGFLISYQSAKYIHLKYKFLKMLLKQNVYSN